MKVPFRLLTRVSILLGSIAATTQAANVVWDLDGAVSPATGGTGAWNQIGGFWNLNGIFVPWSNATNAADTAVFGGTAGTVTLAEAITAGGLQFDVTGYTLAGAGPLTLANNAVIGTNFATTGAATINTTLTGTNLVFNQAPLNGSQPNLGQGRIVLGASTTNTGTTTINGGVVELNNGVTMNTGTGITVNGSGLFHPSATAGTGNEYPWHRLRQGMLRINGPGDSIGAQMVTLNGGTILRLSSAGGSDTATIQNLTLNSGDNILAVGPNGGAPTGDVLAITNLTRNPNATVHFRSQYGTLGANGDNGKVAITNLNGVAIANTNNILGGWAHANEVAANVQGNTFATAFARWDAGLGSVVAATPDRASGGAGATQVNQQLSTGVATENWLVNLNATITADTTINSLIEQNDVIINNNATLRLASGGLIFRTNNFWMQSADATGKLTSGEANGNLYLNAATTVDTLVDLRLRVKITDNGATPVRVVKSGNGSVNIGQYNSGASTVNNYTGGTIIQMGRLQAAALDAFGTGTVTVQPGGQAFLGLAGTYTNAFDLSGAGAQENAGVLGAVRFANGAIISGGVNLSGTARLTASAAAETGTITGVVSGGFGIEKTGAGVLILGGAAANTYTGDTLITGGTLRAGKAQPFGPAGSGIVMVRGGALDTNNFDLGTKIVDIQGTGIGGAGAIVNSAAGTTVGVQRLQLSGDASIGGPGRWDVRGAGSTVTLNGFTLTKTGTNLVSFVQASVGAGKIVVNQGNFGIEFGSSVLAAPNSSIQVNPGGFLWVHDFGSAVTVTRDIILNGGELTSNAGGANGNAVIGSNISAPVASNINVADAGATMRLTGNLTGPGAVTKIGNGVLRAEGSLAGLTTLNVNGGRLVVGATTALPSGVTTIASGAQLESLGANLAIPAAATLVVGRSGAAATDVLGNVTVGAGAALNVGGLGNPRTATFGNNLTLAGSTISFDLGSAITPGGGVNDLVSVAGTLNVSGGNITLAINQLGALASGSYTLFTAGTLIGSAANFNTPAPLPNSRQTLTIDTTSVPNSVLLTAAGSKILTWVGGLAGNVWDVNTTSNWNDGAAADKFFNLDAANFGETGAGTCRSPAPSSRPRPR